MKQKNKNPVSIDRIDHVVLLVNDLKKASDFYCEVLGLWVERWRDEIGLVQLRAGSSMVDLQLNSKKNRGKTGPKGAGRDSLPGQNMHHFALNLRSFNDSAVRKYLKSRNVTMSKTRTLYGADGLGKAIDVVDPDGNIVELKGPPTAKQKREGRNERARAKRKAIIL